MAGAILLQEIELSTEKFKKTRLLCVSPFIKYYEAK